MTEYKYVDVYDSDDFHAGSRLVSKQCQNETEHQDCSGGQCECPCHEPSLPPHTNYQS
jgi:hypothetical protein